MEITLKGHNFQDAVRQVIQLFFDLNSEVRVYSGMTQDEEIHFSALVEIDGKKAAATESRAATETVREIQNTLKKSVFSACRKLSDMPAPWGISTGIRPAKTAREMLDLGFTDEKIIKYMQEEFWMSPQKALLSNEVAKKEKTLLDNRLKNGVSLYVGIPFCPTRCAYCSFISQATRHNEKFIVPYTHALVKEIEHTAKLAEKYGLQPETVYFGGGTPTVLSPESLDYIIKAVRNSFDMSSVREFTVEAGRPDTFSEKMLEVLCENKVNRISINPQTMNQKTLDLIGRKHTVEETIRAFEMAKKYNAFSINADIIAGLPEESEEDFIKTVENIIPLKPDAITVHTMYLKRAARLIGDFEKYRFATSAAGMVEYSYNKLKNEGFLPYYMYKQKNTLGNLENVGYSKIGHECLYNIYIMEEVHTVLAMGGGASTKTVSGSRIERCFNPKEASDYINRIDEILDKKANALKELEV